ncbi:hypothetical protein BKA82DRAFT_33127 [Pisolithus tinctorius]|uniref:Uncharacterized protein n=1 Tax=Pisolithus tinctorius Marx 270 TaxID=870435 RepID=A0A0C3JFW6_PISTI|nr:hypothetical protein BKA82DRAFT_33127 [Pisolithus tinctorius]KIN96516.1 hypothetical protein M404DRAFT_33127 [Pisolithus tinctorius Marx 270]
MSERSTVDFPAVRSINLPPEILTAICVYLDINSLMSIGDALDIIPLVVALLCLRLHNIVITEFRCPPTFLQTLKDHDAVIGGSVSLRLLYAEQPNHWSPNNLDIFVGCENAGSLKQNIVNAGFQIRSTEGVDNPSTTCHIHAIQTFENSHVNLRLVIARTPSATTSIFDTFSTITMNFVTIDGLFCAYPSLTLSRSAIVNPRYRINTVETPKNVQCHLCKYRDRGISFVSCESLHALQGPCIKDIRHLHDDHVMWVLFDQLQPLTNQNICWKLGGPPCNSNSHIIVPYVRDLSLISSSLIRRCS